MAPFLLSSCLDPAEHVQVVKTKATEQFIRNLEPLVDFSGRYFAETVNMVNGLLLGNDYIVPDPRGPQVNGRDVLLQAVEDRLEPLGCRVVPLDCFYPYHRWGGRSTAARTPSGKEPKSSWAPE